ncbi:MAG: hypothetical protein ACJ75H_01620 [Thermoanaerobaculia bacterium]
MRDYERAALDFLGRSLSPRDRQALEAQLAGLDHLKRLHGDRMVTFYFEDPAALPRLSNEGLEQKLATILLEAGKVRTRATAVSHRGLLSSLEFSKPPTDLEGQPLRLALVAGKAGDLAREIDAGEHAEGD